MKFWNTIRPYLWEAIWLVLGVGVASAYFAWPQTTATIDAPGEVKLVKGRLYVLHLKSALKPMCLVEESVGKNLDIVQVNDYTWHIVPHVDAVPGVYSVPVVAANGGKLSQTYWVRFVI